MLSRLLSLALLVAAQGFTALPAAAQEFNDEQRQFYEQYKSLVAISDLRGVNALVGRQDRLADVVLQRVLDQYSATREENLLEEVGPLAVALDALEQGSRYEKRLEYLKGLDPEAAKKRLEAVGILVRANSEWEDARQNKDASLFRRALISYEEALRVFEQVKDAEWASFARFRLGNCHENVGEYWDTVKAYDKAMTEWLEAGRPKDADYGYMVNQRRELIEKGYDPEKDRSSVEGATTRNTPTSFAAGSDWQEWQTEYKEIKNEYQLATPSPYSSEDYLLWREFDFFEGGYCALGWPSRERPAAPFGKGLGVYRDGAKALLDTDGDQKGDEEMKLLSNKPLPATVTRGEGKGADRYALLVTTGSQNEQYLNRPTNFLERGFFKPGCYREAKVLGQNFLLIDDNCSGAFGDFREERDPILRNYPAFMDLDAFLYGKSDRGLPFGDVIRLGDKFYRVKAADTLARTIRTRELDIDVATVQVKWNGPTPPVSLVLAEVREFRGSFFDVAGKDPVTVPAGRYEIAVGKIETGKKKNVSQAWILKGKSKPFELEPGQTLVLEMGAPYTIDFETKVEGGKVVVQGMSQVIHDRYGALIGHVYPEIVVPEAVVRTTSGAALGRPREMELLPKGDYDTGPWKGWCPADLEIEKPPDVEVEIEYTLKKHPLLGGPFEAPKQE